MHVHSIRSFTQTQKINRNIPRQIQTPILIKHEKYYCSNYLHALFIARNIAPASNSIIAAPNDKPQIVQKSDPELQQLEEAQKQASTNVNRIAKDITVRITSANNGGSGVLIAKKGNTYLVLTNAHVTRRTSQFEIQAPDGQKYTAKPIDGGFDRKYDLALLEFTSSKQYQLANLANPGILKPNDRNIYSVGFPFDSKDLRISPGAITQLSDIPFDNGTQIGYEIAKGEKGVRQGMSGGPSEQAKFEAQDKQSFTNGYDLIYTSISYGGMSGGAVFDTEGRVIGIHGQAETTEKAETLLGNSQGISIKTFIGIADKLKVKPQLLNIANNKPSQVNASDFQAIITAMENLTPPQPGDDGERWLAYGNQLYRTLQPDKSVAAFDTAIAKGKELTGNYGKALSLVSAGKYELAQIAIARAIATVPANQRGNYYYFWIRQSQIFRALKKYDAELKAINIAIELEPNDPILRNEKAGVLYRSKKYLEAIDIFTALIRTKPEAYMYNGRGCAKSSLGKEQEAISDFDKAIAINSQFADAYNNRGVAKSALGNKQGAISDFDKAIAINSQFADAYYNRGIAKFALGNKQGAIIDISKAAELFRQQERMEDYQRAMGIIAKLKES